MAQVSQPPPDTKTVALAAGAGGFGGAILGVVAATAMMGDGNNGDGQAAVQPEQPAVVAVAETTD